jgi:hypothetical protein
LCGRRRSSDVAIGSSVFREETEVVIVRTDRREIESRSRRSLRSGTLCRLQTDRRNRSKRKRGERRRETDERSEIRARKHLRLSLLTFQTSSFELNLFALTLNLFALTLNLFALTLEFFAFALLASLLGIVDGEIGKSNAVVPAIGLEDSKTRPLMRT